MRYPYFPFYKVFFNVRLGLKFWLDYEKRFSMMTLFFFLFIYNNLR